MKLSRRGLLAVAATAPVATVLPVRDAAILSPAQRAAEVYRQCVADGFITRDAAARSVERSIAAITRAVAAQYQIPVHILEGRAEP